MSRPGKTSRAFLLPAVLAASSCGAGPISKSPSDGSDPAGRPDRPAAFLSEAEIRRVVEVTAAARGLPERRAVSIAVLAPEAFRARLHGMADDGGDEGQTAGFLLGFDLIPPPGERAEISSVDEILGEQVVGFYDDDADQIFVQRLPYHDLEESLNQRGIIAHEVHHALQAQNFSVSRLIDLPNDDARIAYLSLVEGDAMVAMGAYLGADLGFPLRRTLRRITDVVERVPLEDLAHQKGEALARALPLTRERLTFPYFEGMRFVADIYRAGGFALVDGLYARPPVSTAQILHPEKYVAGELPVEIGDLPDIKGFSSLTQGVLGELQTRVVLGRCRERRVAAQAAAGWAGDRFEVAIAPDGRMATRWLSVWDSEKDAAQFLAAARDPACWNDNDADDPSRPMRISAEVTAEIHGRKVAIVRGLEGSLGIALARAMLAVPATTPAAAPLAGYVIPPRTPLPEPSFGAVAHGVYRSEWLGIEGPLPPGMRVAVGKDGLELLIERGDFAVAGAIALSEKLVNAQFIEQTFDEVAQGLAKGLDGASLVRVSSDRGRIPLGDMVERSWRVDGTSIMVRAVMVPICRDTGSLVFLQLYADDYAWRVLGSWLDSIRWIAGPAVSTEGPGKGPQIKACERLDPQ